MTRVACAPFALMLLAIASCGPDPVETVPPCIAYCDAMIDAGCIPPSNCEESCANTTHALDGDCLAEYNALFQCAAGADLVCTDGLVSTDTRCGSQASDVESCVRDAPCDRICRKAAAAGCDANCSSECDQFVMAFTSFPGAVDCISISALTCGPSTYAIPDQCAESTRYALKTEYGLSTCVAYCLDAELKGCIADRGACEINCGAKEAGACGDTYESVIHDCYVFSICVPSFEGTFCTESLSDYAACTGMPWAGP